MTALLTSRLHVDLQRVSSALCSPGRTTPGWTSLRRTSPGGTSPG